MKIFSDKTLFMTPARGAKTPPAPAKTQMPSRGANDATDVAARTAWVFENEAAPDQAMPPNAAAMPSFQRDTEDERTVLGGPMDDPFGSFGSPASTAPPFDESALINARYEILKQRPSGDHSTVYLAEDQTNGALVILKTVSDPYFSNDAVRNMLLAEADALREAASEGTPKFKDLFYDQDRLFLVMERVRGVSLAHLIEAREVFSLDSTLGLLEAILQVLAACHGRGYLHGDIKPSNIVLRNSRPVVIDWGSAQKYADDEFKVVSLTPKFAAPEAYGRFQGERAGPIGRWSDIYSAFSTVATCMIGPQDRLTFSAVKAALDKERGLSKSLPDEAFDAIEALFAQGLSEEPEGRFQTAQAAIQKITAVRELVFNKFRSPKAPSSETAQVFISYSTKDAAEIAVMIEGLQKIGIETWVDKSSINVGDEWMSEIVQALKDSALVIVYCTENSVGMENPSKHVRREIDLAFEAKKRVAPIFRSGAPFHLDDNAAYLLSGLHRQNWNGDADAFATSLRALL